MNIIKEFKEFALKGSVIDLAVGVIVGTAFLKVVTSLVENVLMPPLGLLIGGVDFSRLRIVLKAAETGGQNEVAVAYGLFLQNSINFLLVAFALFLVIRVINKMRKAPQAATPEEISLLREIRDSLRVKPGR